PLATNPGELAGGAVGVGPDGAPGTGDEVVVAPFARPSLALTGAELALLGPTATLADVSVVGGAVRLAGAGSLVVDSWIGRAPDGSPAPAGGPAIVLDEGSDRVQIVHCQVYGDGLTRAGGSHTAVVRSAFDGASGVALSLAGASPADRVDQSTITSAGGACVTAEGAVALSDTTLFGCAGGGIRLDPGATATIARSELSGNGGPGVHVVDPEAAVEVSATTFGDNAGPAIDRGGDGVDPNDGAGVEAAVLERADLVAADAAHLVGHVGTAAAPSGGGVVEISLARDDGDQLGEVELGDGASLPHGEPVSVLGACPVGDDGRFDCVLVVAYGEAAPGEPVVALATAEAGSAECGPNLVLVDLSPDLDGDGASDVQEAVGGSDPADPDTDDGGVPDGAELAAGGDPTDPSDDDPDLDGWTNDQEASAGTDPLDADTDDDGLSDADEGALGTDPLAEDTDGGGAGDGEELAAGTDPWSDVDDRDPIDPDGDGLPTADEQTTDPYDPDTDDDGLGDGVEVRVFGTDPTLADTDAGGVDDRTELLVDHTDPLTPADDLGVDRDSDGDGLSDREEA
ncbi:MAG: right-handed parallel beta-helix repeat-containing protein, partial [Myxococcota bacterium]